MATWYPGPFRVTHPERSSRPREAGEIVQHRSQSGQPMDSDFIRCPECGAMTQIVGKMQGTDAAPTFVGPLRCGCKVRCGIFFRIRHGTAERIEEVQPAAPTEIPEKLAAMGVAYPKVVTPA